MNSTVNAVIGLLRSLSYKIVFCTLHHYYLNYSRNKVYWLKIRAVHQILTNVTLRLLPWRVLSRFVTQISKPPPMKTPLLMWYRRMVLRAFMSPEIRNGKNKLLLIYFVGFLTSNIYSWNTLNYKRSLWDLLFNKVKSLSLKPVKASSLGANRVNSPSCFSRSVKPAAFIRDKKILQHREENSGCYRNRWGLTYCNNSTSNMCHVDLMERYRNMWFEYYAAF